MIYTSDGMTLSEFLCPDEGYRLKAVIATTYTLNAEHFIGLAKCVRDVVEDAAQNERDSSSTSEGSDMREICIEFDELKDTVKDVLRVYSQYEPESNNRILAQNAADLFKQCGRKVKRKKGLFHPKIILVCMESDDAKWQFRLQVGSQNLTGSNGIEFASRFYGETCDERGVSEPNGVSVSQFINAFISSINGEGESLKDVLETILNTLKKTQFELFTKNTDNKFEVSEIIFAYNDNTTTILEKIKDDINSYQPAGPVIVYSPFLTPDEKNKLFLDNELCLNKGQKTPNIRYFTNLTRKLLSSYNNNTLSNVYASDNKNPFLHGKLIFWKLFNSEQKLSDSEKKDQIRIWLGSANASEGGMKKNAEFMVGYTLNTNLERGEHKYYDEMGSTIEEDKGVKLLFMMAGGTSSQKSVYSKLSGFKSEDCHEENEERYLAMQLLRSITLELSRAELLNGYTLTLGNIAFNNTNGSTGWKIGVENIEPLQLVKEKVEFDIGEEIPPRGVFRISIYDKDENCLASTFRQAETTSIKADVIPKAESMLKLLNQLCALDAIPRCKVKGFSKPDESLYQRLRGYLCSYLWDGKEDNLAWRKLYKRSERILKQMNDPDDQVYFEEEDKRLLTELISFLQEK